MTDPEDGAAPRPGRLSRGGRAQRGTAAPAIGAAFGAELRRREDPRLLAGQGRFLDDVRLAGLLHAAFVRSEFASARLARVDAEAARAHPGVVAVYTAADLAGRVAPIPLIRRPPQDSGEPPALPVLAGDAVRWVGDPIAVVVAETPAQARDGAELVEVDYEPAAAVTGVEEALAEGAPAVHEAFGGNVAFRDRVGGGDVEAAFAAADVVVGQRLVNSRLVPCPLETRGVIARWDPFGEQLDVWISTQRPHHTRWFYAEVLGIPEHRIRVRAGDVGGAFGAKEPMYPDEAAVAFAARELGRAVKWVEDRTESFLATTHGRDQVAHLELAASAEGRISAVRGRIDANMGAYLYPNTPGTVIGRTGPLLPQSYAIAAVDLEIRGVYTHTTPVGPYRGAGRPEATYYMERLVDALARELGLDPAEVRRRNFVPPDAFPYRTPTRLTYDSGDYGAALELALEEVGYADLRSRRGSDEHTLVGVGVASYVEIGGVTPSSVAHLENSPGLWESAEVVVHPTGRVEVRVGTCAHGQGHETAFAQVAADELGLDYEDVVVRFGDTATSPFGFGTFGSRSGAVGGAAVRMASGKVAEKARRIAARMLEADAADVEQSGGRFSVRGDPAAELTFADVARASIFDHAVLAEGEEPGLDASARFDPPDYTFSSGTHACVVEVERATGRVRIRRYVGVDDCGTVINPLIVDGQVHGGVAQGIGQALYEHVCYDDAGQPLTASLMDYVMASAAQLPRFETHRVESPSPANPLGVKGVGESGAIVATAAVANAVADALAQAGAGHLDLPFTPMRVWEVLEAAGPEGDGAPAR